MKGCELAQTWRWALAVLLLLILIALAADWVLLLQLHDDIACLADDRARKDTLPCAALPTRFVLESPDCAQKLLDSMNVTNVRVLPRGSSPLSSPRP